MLSENTPVRQEQSALERRIAMGLSPTEPPPAQVEVDVEEFMADEDRNAEEDSE